MNPVTILPSKIQREIIIGNILGDGSLEFNRYIGTRLQIKQSEQYKDYVLWLYEKLKNLCNSRPKQRKDNNQWYFSTRALKELTSLHKLFYKKRRKIIPYNISELLTSPLTVAVWYMDDGSLDFRPKDHYAFVLNTDSFLLKEVQILGKTIERNFGVKTNVYNSLCRGRRYPKIYIGAKGRDKFLSLVKPYILNCFSHKLPSL
ncbi:MAG: hypothetical protein QMC93_02340 [Patescibacteria group bacterium]|nr:hypothetical protein [Patescibacteria group bacterium]